MNGIDISKVYSAAERCDAALSKRAGYTVDSIMTYTRKIIRAGSVEVGFRTSCGSTDFTMYVNREWRKVIKQLQKLGLSVVEQPIQHGNAYATNKGGFWSSSVYKIQNHEDKVFLTSN